MPFKPGQSGNPGGKKPGAKTTKTKLREDWRAENTPRVLKVFADALQGKKIGEQRWEAAKELRKAVLPDLRPIDADSGSSAEIVVVVGSQSDADALAQTLKVPHGSA